MSKYWGYARVSTEEQSDYSIAHQLAYLEYKAKEVNMEFLPKSEKQSGSDLKKRKMLQLILEKSQRGDIVGFYDSSRLGRNTQDSLQIIDKLTRKGVSVQIGGKTFDESSPRDELLFTIEAAISSFYRKEQNLKSHVGIELSKKNGNWIFTGNLLGYDVKMIRNKKIIEINEEEAEIIKFIFTTYAKGESINKTTKLLNERGFRTKRGFRFNAASVRRTIHKPIYMGYYKLEGSNRKGQDTLPLDGSTLVKSNYYKPIIDEDLWYKVQKSYRTLKRAHARQFEYRYAHYELSSILKCYYCKEMGKATGYAHSYHKATRSRNVNGK